MPEPVDRAGRDDGGCGVNDSQELIRARPFASVVCDFEDVALQVCPVISQVPFGLHTYIGAEQETHISVSNPDHDRVIVGVIVRALEGFGVVDLVPSTAHRCPCLIACPLTRVFKANLLSLCSINDFPRQYSAAGGGRNAHRTYVVPLQQLQGAGDMVGLKLCKDKHIDMPVPEGQFFTELNAG